ncbi:hypothetical protein ACFT2C_06320 [Promicromonospora sp. NPDC057138]|uniref:hypothetical protein n=1 Tax=Promicromonospora sp. NPDC057138 TaxID=3346031 RepID=UPI00362B88E7
MANAISASPTSTDPGRIGVAVIDQDGKRPVQISAQFAVAADSSTRFQIVVSDLTDATEEVALFFCGPIRDGLDLEEVNQGPLVLSQAPNSPARYDSVLGDRSECSYTTSRLEPGHQTIVVGQSRYSFLARTGANVLYTVPGVRTVLTREDLGGETMAPLDPASTVSITMAGLPNDLQIAAAVPQLPDSGLPSWSYEVGGQPRVPGEYRVMGHLVTVENRAQATVFFAGAFVGISGAAVLWLIEILVTGALGGRPRGEPADRWEQTKERPPPRS